MVLSSKKIGSTVFRLLKLSTLAQPKFHRTAVGVKCKDGVVVALEKLLTSKMLVPGSNRRIFTIDRHIGVVSIEAVAIGRTECIFIWCRALQ